MKRTVIFTAVMAFVAGALTSGCKKPHRPEITFLNFDPETSEGALKRGFSGWERTPDGDTFSWSNARQVEIKVDIPARTAKLVRMRVWPFHFQGAPPQTLSLTVNELAVPAVTLGERPGVISMLVPAEAWKEGENTIRCSFAYAESPLNHLPGIEDSRTLSVAFDWIEITTPRKGDPAKKGQ